MSIPGRTWLWIGLGSGFGALSGPLVSATVNHGRPGYAALFAAPFLLFFGMIFHWTVVVVDEQPWRSALPKVAAVLIGGSILFMLPHSLALTAEGDFWWRTEAERYAVYCAPYPFVSWLVFSRSRRRLLPLATCVAVAACLVAAWPKLQLGATAQTAAMLRNEIGLPAASIYAIGVPGTQPTDGYYADHSTVTLPYLIEGDDVSLTVYPAHGPSPCPDLIDTIGWVLPDFVSGAGTCVPLPHGRWQAIAAYDDHVTQVERVDGYFIALTVGTETAGPDEQFPQLFASLHHPNAAELVAIGVSGAFPSPLE